MSSTALSVSPLECKGNYSATSNNRPMKVVPYTSRWWVGPSSLY